VNYQFLINNAVFQKVGIDGNQNIDEKIQILLPYSTDKTVM